MQLESPRWCFTGKSTFSHGDYWPKRTPLISIRLEVSRSHRILWLFEELGLEYELKTYKRTKEGLAPPELREVFSLGKAPVVTIQPADSSTPIALAESAAIAEYFCDYYDKGGSLVPKRYQEGKEGQLGGETESWLRYRMFMHYAEGSIMPMMLLSLIVGSTYFSHLSCFGLALTGSRDQELTSSIFHQADHE